MKLHALMRARLERASRTTTTIRASMLLLSGLALAACGGGGGSGGGLASTTPGGIDRSGRAVGPVTAFGSVFVNGIEFSTSGATVTKDGVAATEHDLEIGQIVTVTGTRNEARTAGTATSIVFENNVEGPIASIDLANKQMVVVGQTVHVNADTVYDAGITPAGLDGLAVGNVVEVSGLADRAGVVQATRIDRTANTEVDVRGAVSALDSGNKLFTLGSQRVDYSNATLAGFSNGASIANGQSVEVRGTSFDNGGTLVATRVELKSSKLLGNDGQQGEIEGLITRFASAQNFDVSGQPVTTSSSTTFRNGVAADLALGKRVEVQGTVTAGALAATVVELQLGSDRRVEGSVQTVDAAAKQLTVLGNLVAVDVNTQFEDNGPNHRVPFSLANISVGDYVKVRGRVGSGNVDILATRIERDVGQVVDEVQGKVTSIGDPTFVINDVTITVGDGTRIKDANGHTISKATFFAALHTGDKLHVQGDPTGTAAIAATQIEYDD